MPFPVFIQLFVCFLFAIGVGFAIGRLASVDLVIVFGIIILVIWLKRPKHHESAGPAVLRLLAVTTAISAVTTAIVIRIHIL